jgi:hypothetical protein
MNHPILIAALVEDRRHRCLYGTFAQQPDGLCRECQAVARCLATRDHTDKPPYQPQLDIRRNREAHLFALVASLLQIIGKGAES